MTSEPSVSAATSAPSAADSTRRPLNTLAQELEQGFLERSDGLDRTQAFPHENFADLRRAGLLQMALPDRFGGHNADLQDINQVLETLARACPSTALIFNMHLAFTAQLAHLWRLDPDGPWGDWMQQIQVADMLVGGALSETKSWNAVIFPQTVATAVEGGYIVDGVRSFCTGSEHLGYIQCTAQIRSAQAPSRAIYFILSQDMQGIEWKEDWDTLGMRASASHGFLLNKVYIPQSHVLYEYPYGAMDTSQLWLSFLTTSFVGFAAIYAGIAEQAKTEALTRIITRSRAPGTHPLTHKPAVQRHAAQMMIGSRLMSSLRDAYVAQKPIGSEFGLEDVLNSSIAKQLCIQTALTTVDHAIAQLGGQAYFKSCRLERLLRDVRAGPFHPFSQDDSLEMMGKLMFGLSFMTAPGWAL